MSTATVGREGVVGLAATVVESPASIAAMAQSDIDVCYRMKACAFRREMDRRGEFHAVITRYSQALMAFIMRSAARLASLGSFISSSRTVNSSPPKRATVKVSPRRATVSVDRRHFSNRLATPSRS